MPSWLIILVTVLNGDARCSNHLDAYALVKVFRENENEFANCWRQVKSISLEPYLWSSSCWCECARHEQFFNVLSAAFPKLQKLSVMVNPSVSLGDGVQGDAAVCAPSRRCRLVEAAEDLSLAHNQSSNRSSWTESFINSLMCAREPGRAIPAQIQVFEVYVGRRGHMRWKQHTSIP